MQNIIYLDNSSTTVPCREAIDGINKALTDVWGNPSSTHCKGVEAFLELSNARAVAAASVGCRSDEIIFTSCGSEANNLAIIGTAVSKKKTGNKIVSTAVEHPSALKALDYLESCGFEIVKLEPDTNGYISPEKFKNAIDKNTVLVTVMMVNNELGTIQNISEISKIIKENSSPALFHCDAVQSYGKLPIKVNQLGVDLMSVSGHKIHASKGIGFLYKKKSVNITPIIHGGAQENGFRSGTESLPLIIGFSEAVKALPDPKTTLSYIKELNSYARDLLNSTGLVEFNSSEEALPYILNISVNGYKSEPLLNAMSQKGICVSKGSACAKGQRSYVLKSCGFSDDRIDSALRISFSRYNTKKDIEIFVQALKEITSSLRRYK